MSDKGLKLEKENFIIEVKYSPEAIEKKLVKFTVTKGTEIVLSADEIISMLVNQVNSELLSASFVETQKINVVRVSRQLKCKLERDFKKGDVVNLTYVHPYPIEFAIIEEAFKIAKIQDGTKVFELTQEFLESVRKRITPKMVDYTKKVYESFNSLNLKNKRMEQEYTGEMGKFKVIGVITPIDPETSEPQAALELGSVHEVPVALGNDWVANGLAEKVVEEAAPAGEVAEAPVEVAPEAPAVEAEQAPVEVEGVDEVEKQRLHDEAVAKANSNHSDSPSYTGPTNY